MADVSILQLGLGAAVTCAFHPVTYAKILIQLGHEPLAPVATTTVFGRPALCYPNVFKYIGHIRSQDGFLGLYRGLGARLCGGIIGSATNTKVTKMMKEFKRSDEIDGDEEENVLNEFLYKTSSETAARCAGMIVSHPFHVIMVRTMAQFVGEEKTYSSLFGSLAEIFRRDGILGFFVGLIPRLLGEVITVWLTNSLILVVNRYLLPEEMKHAKGYTSTFCTLMVTQLTYPFSLVANVMAVSGSGLQAGSLPIMPTYADWRGCMKELSAQGQLKRGSSIFFRYYKGPVSVFRHDGRPIRASGAFAPPSLS